MSYLTRVDDRREDEMADYAYIEKCVKKVYAYCYRGNYDKIPQFFKRNLKFRRYDEAQRMDIVDCWDDNKGDYVTLRIDDYIVIKGDDVRVYGWNQFSTLYTGVQDFAKYE